MNKRISRVIAQIERLISIRSSIVVVLLFVLSTLLNYSFQIFGGRYLGSAKYGLLAGLMSIMSITTVACSAFQVKTAKTMAMGLAQKRQSSIDPQLLSATRFSIKIALLFGFFMPVIANFWNVGIVPLLIISMYVVPAVWDSIAAGRFQGSKNFSGLAGYSLLQAFLKFSALIIVVVANLGVTSLISLVSFFAGVGALIGYWKTRNRGQLNLEPFDIESKRISSANTLLWMMLTMDVIVAQSVLEGNAGNYAAASTIAKVLLWMPTLTNQIIFPHLATRKHNEQTQVNLIRLSLMSTLLVSSSGAALVAFFGPLMIQNLYGPTFIGADRQLWQLCLGFIPYALAQVLLSIHFVNGEKFLPIVLGTMTFVQGSTMIMFANSVASFSVILGTCGMVLVITLLCLGNIWRVFIPTSMKRLINE